MKTFTVYMPYFAAELRKKGFKIIKVVPNEKKPQFDAYIFEDTPELQRAFSALQKKQPRKPDNRRNQK